jgi:hypothetical protein
MSDLTVGFILGLLVMFGIVKLVQFWDAYDREYHVNFNSRKIALIRSLKTFRVFDV